MKRVILQRFCSLTIFMLLLLFTLSCSDDSKPIQKSSIDQISVNLDFNFVVTGNIVMTVRETDTNEEVGTSTVSIVGFTDANDGWIDFSFSPSLEVVEGATYQIEMKRSTSNTPYQDVALWRSGTGDVYIYGSSSAVGTPNAPNGDFSFKTFIDGVVDQQQESINQLSILDNTSTLIQEFVPGK